MAAKAKSADNGKSRPVTLKHFAATLAPERRLTEHQNQALLEDLIGLITKFLKKSERITITGFGILQVRKRAPRMCRSLATGEAIIEASEKAAFRSPRRAEVTI
jgi:DNA-binding protein HU-beta